MTDILGIALALTIWLVILGASIVALGDTGGILGHILGVIIGPWVAHRLVMG